MRLAGIVGATLVAAVVAADVVAAQARATLRGRVTDAGTGLPVAGAVIAIEGGVVARTLTDADGRWTVETEAAERLTVSASHIGYAATEVVVEVSATAPTDVAFRLTPRALPLDAVVVTASRRLQRLAEVPVATELITRREIELVGTSDLSQVLVERLGVQLEAGVASGEGVMIQGMGSQRVLVLVDGQPLVGRVGGVLDVSRIPAAAVERIEVVRGPQSSLYGSDAIGGVVNVVTRTAGGPRWRGAVGVTAGTQGRADATLSAGGSVGDLGYAADLGHRETEQTPGRSGRAGALAERWDALVKFEWRPVPAVGLRASGLLVDDFQRWRTGQLYNFAEGTQRVGRLSAEIDFGGGRLTPTVHVSEFDRVFSRATAAEPVEGTGERELQRLVEAELIYNGSLGSIAIDGGVEAKHESIRSDRVAGGSRSYRSVEPFAQATVTLGAVQVVPGARLTLSDAWGTHLTPRIAAMYRPVDDVAVRFGLGLGFRAPDFKELGMEFFNLGTGTGYVIRGNPDLKPETSGNVTVGLEWTRPTTYVRLQGFYNRFRDFIETTIVGDSSGITLHTYDNVARGHTRGAEVELGITRGGVRAEAGYAWLQTRDLTSDESLLGRPAHSGRLLLEHPLPAGVRAAVVVSHTGATPVQRTGSEEIVRPAFTRLDVRFGRGLPGGFEASLGIRNLLDHEPENWPDSARRHVHLTIDWQFSADPS